MEVKNILIITQTQGYLMLSLKNMFEEEGYDVIYVEPDIDGINSIKQPVAAVLIYADEQLAENRSLLVYLKDWTSECELPAFAAGSAGELEKILSVTGQNMLCQTFTRPLNTKDMIHQIHKHLCKCGCSRKKILVVDDSGAMLRNVKGWLEDRYQVILANSGAMAIKYLALDRPDLILLDYEMPILNGRQMLEMIRAERDFEDIPVIFLTSKDDKASVLKVMSLKPEGYLLKTLPPERIVQEVDNFFERRKASAHL